MSHGPFASSVDLFILLSNCCYRCELENKFSNEKIDHHFVHLEILSKMSINLTTFVLTKPPSVWKSYLSLNKTTSVDVLVLW